MAAIAASVGAAPRALRAGIGDDAAAWKARSPGHLRLLTTDMLVDGVHFRLHDTLPEALGHKALAVNLSDIAAMGGTPEVAVVGIGLTNEIGEEWIREFYRGAAALAAKSRCAIAGGDIVRAPKLTLAVSVAGDVRSSNLRLRSGARPGDVIAISGPLGLAAAGLRAIDARIKSLRPADAATVCDAYLRPEPRLRDGKFLASRGATRALMDISDGLSTDLGRMAQAAGLDAVIERTALQIDPALRKVAKVLGADPLALVLHGGDDYELLVAIERRAFGHVARSYARRFGRELRGIGRFEAGSGRVWIELGGHRAELPRAGWDHLEHLSTKT